MEAVMEGKGNGGGGGSDLLIRSKCKMNPNSDLLQSVTFQ